MPHNIANCTTFWCRIIIILAIATMYSTQPFWNCATSVRNYRVRTERDVTIVNFVFISIVAPFYNRNNTLWSLINSISGETATFSLIWKKRTCTVYIHTFKSSLCLHAGITHTSSSKLGFAKLLPVAVASWGHREELQTSEISLHYM